MSEAIIVAMLALFGTLAGSWAGVRQANKLVNYRIDNLEAQVDKLGQVLERVIIVESKADAANHRLDDHLKGVVK